MTTIEDKIKLFTKIIYEKIDDANNEDISKFKSEKQSNLEELKKHMKEKKSEVAAETLKKAEIKSSEIITAQKIKSHQEILHLKQKIISETIDLVKKKFEEFVQTDEYKQYLIDLIEGCIENLSKGEYIIYLTQQDLKKYETDIKTTVNKYNLQVSIEQTNSNLIGGILIKDKVGKYRIDCSFETKINDNRDLIGLKLMDKNI